jgi:hypothetical protein
MTTMPRFGIFAMILLFFLPSGAQERPLIVKLKVEHNGRERPVPEQVTLSSDEHSVRVSVRDGKFEIPPEFAHAKSVTFATVVDGEDIRIPAMRNEDFTEEY